MSRAKLSVREGDRLYDQDHFRARQEELASITEKKTAELLAYPPTCLSFFLAGKISYSQALLLWWLGLVVCFSLPAGACCVR